MTKTLDFKLKVIRKRAEGYSINELAKQFHISKSTVSLWVRDTPVTETGMQRLTSRIPKGPIVSGLRRKARSNALRRLYFESAKIETVKNRLDSFSQKLVCAMIYWCEGAKKDDQVRFTNSDPDLTRKFIDLLEKEFCVKRYRIKCRLHLHSYHSNEELHRWWSGKLNIGLTQFQKPYLKLNGGQRIRLGYPGCVHISYYDTIVARRLLFLAKAYLEKGFVSDNGGIV